ARFGYNGLLLRSARPDQIADDDKTRCDADARLERRVGLQITYSSDQLQPCAYCPLGVVLVRMGVAEVEQHPVAHELRDETAEATYGLRGAILIGRNDLAEVFGVHTGRKRR